MPKGRKHYHHFVDKDADKKLAEERQANADRLPPARRPRGMAEFSPDELSALQAKLERWVREGTCRVH
jgi:hypothetical protein